MEDYLSIYEPNNSIKKGYMAIFREIFKEIKQNRWLIYQLFRRDFLAMYKQSFVGIFWAIIIPLASLGTFVILNRSGIFSSGNISIPYPLYVILSMSFWQLFSTGLVAGSNSLVKAGSMIVKINFSKKSLVVASTGQAIVPFIIHIVMALILFAYYRIVPNVAILMVPLIILPLILLTLGISFILSIFNGIVRDVGNIISILLTFLMFLTPIFYTKPTYGVLECITRLNPLYYFISAPRDLAIYGTIFEWTGFLISSIGAFLIFGCCLLAFHLTETRVAERI